VDASDDGVEKEIQELVVFKVEPRTRSSVPRNRCRRKFVTKPASSRDDVSQECRT